MNIRAKIFGTQDPVEEVPVLGTKRPKGVKADVLNSIPVIREEHRRGNTRGSDRHRLPEGEVQVSHDGTRHSVQLVNLSGGGAMVAGGFEPKLWDRVDLHLGEDGMIECAVRWLKGDRVGLEFAHETRLDCSADEQAKLLRSVIANNFIDVEYEAPFAEQREVTSDDEHRRAYRHPLIWSGVLHYDFTSAPCRLRNISESGAQIEFEVPLPIGAEPLLDLGAAGTIFATVTWTVGDHAGLKFHTPFDLTALAQARPQIAGAKWQRPSYLQSDGPADSPWAPEWGRKSLGELRDELEGFMKR